MKPNETLVVVPNVQFNTLRFPLCYNDPRDGKTYFMTSSGHYKCMPTDEFNEWREDKKKSKGMIAFPKFKAKDGKKAGVMRLDIPCEVDADGKLIGEVNKTQGDQGYALFYSNAIFSETDGIRGIGTPFFKAIFLNKSKQNQVIQNKDVFRIGAMLMDMSVEEIAHIASFFGRPTYKKSKNDLLVDLTDPKSGFLWSNKGLIEKFNEAFVDKTNKHAELIININKARELNVIRDSMNGKQKVFHFKDTQVGLDMEAVRATFTQDNDLYKSLQMELKMKLEKSAEGEQKEKIIDDKAKANKTEELREMRGKLQGLVKSDSNPEGVWDIGKRKISLVPEAELRAAYKKYVLKEE